MPKIKSQTLQGNIAAVLGPFDQGLSIALLKDLFYYRISANISWKDIILADGLRTHPICSSKTTSLGLIDQPSANREIA